MTAYQPQPDCNPTALELQMDCRKTALSASTPSKPAIELQAPLQQLTVGRKAKRLLELWPAIEVKLAEGISHAQILVALNENGLQLTERTYKSYLYRYRKRQRTAQNNHELRRIPEPSPPRIANHVPAPECFAPEAKRDNRPPTFDFDPRGLSPELLK